MNAEKNIYVVTWGATMVLADFFDLWSDGKTCAHLPKKEYGPYGSERCEPDLPPDDDKPHGFRVELTKYRKSKTEADQIEIYFNKKWRSARKWDGNPVHIDTCD